MLDRENISAAVRALNLLVRHCLIVHRDVLKLILKQREEEVL